MDLLPSRTKVKKLFVSIMGQGNSHHHHGRTPGHTPPTNYDLPPLKFHNTHGENIFLNNDDFLAVRRESYCKGIVFSHRPVMVGERICLKITELSSRWSGVIRVGFTSHDPVGMENRLPKYACPDLTKKAGYWAKALSDRCIERNAIIHYYVTANGDVHFGINGGDLGVFFSGIDTRQPLWAMIDLYGNCTSIELIDARRTANNFSRASTTATSTRSSLRSNANSNANNRTIVTPTYVALPAPAPEPVQPDQAVDALNSHLAYIDLSSRPAPVPAATYAEPPRSSASTRPTSGATGASASRTSGSDLSSSQNSGPVPQIRFNRGINFKQLPFHPSTGKNVKLDATSTMASRHDEEFAQGYVFTRQNVTPGERIVIQVLSTEESYIGSLAFGLTNVDPGSMDLHTLPEDSDLLIDRPEYWVVSKDVANSPAVGDELSFAITTDGTVEFMRNDGIPSVFMHVDITQPLWAFWDVYGHTSRIRILGSTTVNLPRPSGVAAAAAPGMGVDPAQDANALLNLSTTSTATTMSVSECTVCYEKPVDCVLYTCGHMCMCYDCALQQWRGRGGGFCPMCRLAIRDVIKTFRS